MITVGVVGATGYTGGEVLRLLAQHPQFKVTIVTSRSDAGRAIDDAWPALAGHLDLTLVEPSIEVLADVDLVFLATPNGTAMTMVPDLLACGIKAVDLSADFRLKSENVWSEWYGETHQCPELLSEAVYGIPELNREDIKSARLVANPGCYPTAISLGLLPLLENNLIDPGSIIADAKSGVSGAGRGLNETKLFGSVSEDFKAYGVSGHRHHPEITQTLNSVSADPVTLTFVPHLLPMFRGIHATIYVNLLNAYNDLQSLFETRYADHPFVQIAPIGACPNTASVMGSNNCRIAVHPNTDGRRVIVLSVIDNLVKGAAGIAVQNANLMFGLEENAGLDAVALFP